MARVVVASSYTRTHTMLDIFQCTLSAPSLVRLYVTFTLTRTFSTAVPTFAYKRPVSRCRAMTNIC